ncbi:hypothetical protein EG329_004213 [Mollisiaceae sp. DMI_Dod_QoI]|nr:hypothetical protein EG329_004213 [Helotiales sp. DMI_Dod_QoI]
MGDSSCWEATNLAREEFSRIAERIKDYLEKYSDPISDEVTWSMYMIGKTKETADPTIMFSGRDPRCRKQIKKTIKESGILDKHPGMKLGDASRPPDFDQLVPLAGRVYGQSYRYTTSLLSLPSSAFSDFDDWALEENFYSNQVAFAEASGCLAPKKLFIPIHDSNRTLVSVRLATGGGIVNASGRHFYLTAGHAFEDRVDLFYTNLSKKSDEFQFDLTEEIDSDDEIDLVDTTSRGSISLDIAESITSDDTSGSSNSRAQFSTLIARPKNGSSPPEKQRIASAETPAKLKQMLLGSVSVGRLVKSLDPSVTVALDYSLMEISSNFPLFDHAFDPSSGPP